MPVVFFGTPDFAVPSLRALLDSGETVSAVVCQPDRPQGRGRKVVAPAVKEFAAERDIPVLQPEGIRHASFIDEISRMNPETIAVVAYGKILPPALLKLPRLGCVNVHASLLPRYRGAAPIQWAVMRCEPKTGITTMMMDEGLDTGDVLMQEETAIAEEETARSLGARLSQIGARLLLETLKGLRNGLLRPVPQSGEPSYAPVLSKDDGRIDWRKPAREIGCLVRGTAPWPGAFCFFAGERLSVLRAGVLEQHSASSPGTILCLEGDAVHVAAGSGAVSLIEVKPDGKKAMPAAAFLRGRRLPEGTVFDV